MRTVLAALALLLSGCTPAHDADDAGLRFMILMKKASGGPALDRLGGFHQTGETIFDGETRTYEIWGDFHALRTVSTTTSGDGLTVTYGFDGNTGWQIGPDGDVKRLTAPDVVAEQRLAAYVTVTGYFFPDRFPARFEYAGRREARGIAYDVVTVTPEDAPSIDLWLDTESHRLQRLTGQNGDLSYESEIRRYDAVDGVSVPAEMVQTVGGQTIRHKVLTLEFTDVADARFAPPESE